jgi:hypothetical protein
MTTNWQTPQFTELSMNAEIGSYQPDFDPDETPPFVDDASADERAKSAGQQGA